MSAPDDEWRALGPGIRRVVWKNARHLRAHPDPAVPAVAARYARWHLDARSWHARTQRAATGLMRMCRLELAGRLTLESAAADGSARTQAPPPGRAPGPERDVSVRYDKRRAARQSGWLLLIVCCMLAVLAGRACPRA